MSISKDLEVIKKLFRESGVDEGCATEFFVKNEKEFESEKVLIQKKYPNCKFFVKEEKGILHIICLNVRFDDEKANKLVNTITSSINSTNTDLLKQSSFDPSKLKFNMFRD